MNRNDHSSQPNIKCCGILKNSLDIRNNSSHGKITARGMAKRERVPRLLATFFKNKSGYNGTAEAHPWFVLEGEVGSFHKPMDHFTYASQPLREVNFQPIKF